MFCKDVAWSSVLPFKCHPLVHLLVRDVRLHNIVPSQMQEMKKYCCEMGDFLEACVNHGCPNLGASFCEHLVLKMELVHQCNTPAPDAEDIPKTLSTWEKCILFLKQWSTGKFCVCTCKCVYMNYLFELSFVNTNFYFQSVYR